MSENLKHHRLTRGIIHERPIDLQRDYEEVHIENPDEEYVLRLLASDYPRHDKPGQAHHREIDALFAKILLGQVNELADTTSRKLTVRMRAKEKKQREASQNQKL